MCIRDRSHAFSLSQSQRILDEMAGRKVLLTGHFGHYLRRSEAWRHARIACLEQAAAVPTEKLALVLEVLDRHATRQGLIPVESLYVAASRDRSQLHLGAAPVEGRQAALGIAPL